MTQGSELTSKFRRLSSEIAYSCNGSWHKIGVLIIYQMDEGAIRSCLASVKAMKQGLWAAKCPEGFPYIDGELYFRLGRHPDDRVRVGHVTSNDDKSLYTFMVDAVVAAPCVLEVDT